MVDNYLTGFNQSRRVGQGMEFSQFRGYEQGDDLRLLDWKMLARSGRYYIKQSEIDTNISVKFIIDASESMLHEENAISKIDYAKVLVATLAFLAQKQGDAVGFFSFNENGLSNLQPKVNKQHFQRLLQNLIDINVEGRWPQSSSALNRFHDKNQRELVFFLTDFYEDESELSDFIKSLKTIRNEVVVVQIMGKKELEFNYKGNLTFHNLESRVEVKVNAAEIKQSYLQSMESFMQRNKEFLLSNDISYSVFTIGNPLEETLQLFLKKRLKLT